MAARTKKQLRTDWLTPLDIPEGKLGDFAVRHEIVPAGKGVMFNSLRSTMMGGQRGEHEIKWDYPTRWHHLEENGSRWIADWPIEQRQHDECLKGFQGHVLVGGLGIGYAAQTLAARKEVKKVTVVEISPEVKDLVYPHLKHRDKILVITADLLVWLNEAGARGKDRPIYDRAFYDIWKSDGEGTFFSTVVPLHQLSASLVRRAPACWNEDVMRGQLSWSIQSRLMLTTDEAREHLKIPQPKVQPWEEDGTDKPWHNWTVAFFQWWRETNPDQDKVREAVGVYSSLYGKAHWQSYWAAYIAS